MQEIVMACEIGETDVASSQPKVRCFAGHNFGDMLGSSEAEVRALLDVCTEMMTLIQALPQVVIARVRACHGRRMPARSMCDLAVAAESAAFAAPGGKGGRSATRRWSASLGPSAESGPRMALSVIRSMRTPPPTGVCESGCRLSRRPTNSCVVSLGARLLEGARHRPLRPDRHGPGRPTTSLGVMTAGAVAPDGQEGIAAFVEKRRPEFGPVASDSHERLATRPAQRC